MPAPIESLTTAAISAALDAGARRQAAIAANIANASTPGYVPVRLAFDEYLAEAQQAWSRGGTIDASHVDALRGTVWAADGEAGAPAGVQVDVEMAELARNAAQFQALTQALSRHLAMLALAAADGRR